MRQAPSVINTINTTENSSGKMDMASVIPANSPPIQSCRITPINTQTSNETSKPTAAKRRIIIMISSCRGLSGDSTVFRL